MGKFSIGQLVEISFKPFNRRADRWLLGTVERVNKNSVTVKMIDDEFGLHKNIKFDKVREVNIKEIK